MHHFQKRCFGTFSLFMNAKEMRKSVGQCLWIGFEGDQLDKDTRRTLESGDAGGVTLFARNLPKLSDGRNNIPGLIELNRDIHSTNRNVWISVDQEGGRVQRVKEPCPHYPPMIHLADMEESKAIHEAEKLGKEIGGDLKSWGFDIDFAPVMDIHTNEQNPIIGDRAFGTTPKVAIPRALAFARGLHAAEIFACAKHFPGHGDTETDSHLELPTLPHDMKRLEAIELLPFRAAAQANIPLCMTAHVVFKALDAGVPATLSRKVVTGLLKERLEYKGVVVSDDLDMHAIAKHMAVDEAAVRAIEAGCDVLLLCRDRDHQEIARDALVKEASNSGAFLKLLQKTRQLVPFKSPLLS